MKIMRAGKSDKERVCEIGVCLFVLRGEGQRAKDKILVKNKCSQGITSIEGSLCYKEAIVYLFLLKKKCPRNIK